MDECKDQKIPKEATCKKWKGEFPWLKILSICEQKKLMCKICTDLEEKLKQMPHMNLMFVNGSSISVSTVSQSFSSRMAYIKNF